MARLCCECGKKLTRKQMLYRRALDGVPRMVCIKCDKDLQAAYLSARRFQQARESIKRVGNAS